MPENKAIYPKYMVYRMDGKDNVGEKHEKCDLFVLDLTHDPAAIPAMAMFVTACADDRPALSASVWATFPAVDAWLKEREGV